MPVKRCNALCGQNVKFLDVFAMLRKATFLCFVSVRLSAWRNSVPTGRISINLYIWVFFGNLARKFKFNEVWHRVLYMKTNKHVWSHLAQFFLEWEMLQTRVVERNKARILCSVTFFRKPCCLWNNLWEYCRAGQATDDNMAHAQYCNLRPLVKGQGSVLSLEGGTDRMSRNVGKKLTTTRVITQKSAVLIHIAAEAWNQAEYSPVNAPGVCWFDIEFTIHFLLISHLHCGVPFCTLCVCLRLM